MPNIVFYAGDKSANMTEKKRVFYYVCIHLLFCTGDWTQGLQLARQELYHLSHNPNPYYLIHWLLITIVAFHAENTNNFCGEFF
jgi:hypothetical protein